MAGHRRCLKDQPSGGAGEPATAPTPGNNRRAGLSRPVPTGRVPLFFLSLSPPFFSLPFSFLLFPLSSFLHLISFLFHSLHLSFSQFLSSFLPFLQRRRTALLVHQPFFVALLFLALPAPSFLLGVTYSSSLHADLRHLRCFFTADRPPLLPAIPSFSLLLFLFLFYLLFSLFLSLSSFSPLPPPIILTIPSPFLPLSLPAHLLSLLSLYLFLLSPHPPHLTSPNVEPTASPACALSHRHPNDQHRHQRPYPALNSQSLRTVNKIF